MRKVLIFSQGINLTHFFRPLILIKQLLLQDNKVTFLLYENHQRFIPKDISEKITIDFLKTVNPTRFQQNILDKTPVFSLKQLQAMIDEDLAMIDQHGPDVIIGDLRFSLAVSARLKSIPYITITNAHWSSKRVIKRIEIVDSNMGRVVDSKLFQGFFSLFHKQLLALHTIPLNLMKKKHNLRNYISYSYFDINCEGDFTLYADHPDYSPLEEMKDCEFYIGPMEWFPPGELPSLPQKFANKERNVYINMGNMGPIKDIHNLIDACVELDLRVILGTCGRFTLPPYQEKSHFIYADHFIPGDKALNLSALSISPGGVSAVYPAIKRGVYTLAIPGHLDAYLSMQGAVVNKIGEIMFHTKLPKKKLVKEVLSNILSKLKNIDCPLTSQFQSFPIPQNIDLLFETIFQRI
jgi:UDP:flavonoid glycosyltransferase YjiC (YdhE family)